MTSPRKLPRTVGASCYLASAMTCLSNLLGLVTPIAVVHLVSQAWHGRLYPAEVWVATGTLLAVLFMQTGASFVSTWQSHRAAYRTLTDLRQAILTHLKCLPLGFFQTRKVGDLVTVMKNDVEQVEVYLAHGRPEAVSAVVIPLSTTIAMLILDWRLALAMVWGIPLMLAIKRLSAPKWEKGFEIVAGYNTAMQERLTEYVATIPVIKAFSKSEDKTAAVLATAKDYVKWVTKSMNTISVPMGLISLCMEIGMVSVVITGTWLLQSRQIGVEILIVAIILAAAFSASMAKIATLQHYRVMFSQAMKGITPILDVPLMKRSQNNTPSEPGELMVERVSFSYPGADSPAVQDINIKFAPNSTTALVGASGCGKSTLAHLMMGFWEPDTGTISVSGVKSSDVNPDDWSQLFAIVQQDVFLFNLSLEENLRIGNQDATFAQVVQAAKRARIHDFIESLPQGYATLAGEAGSRFSGGEKQRLSIARAILKNCPFVILDEATSALDAENEALVQAAITELAQDKTIITIEHHLSSVVTADQIVVMASGQVMDTGSHEVLLARCDLYRQMVASQKLVDTWDIMRCHQ